MGILSRIASHLIDFFFPSTRLECRTIENSSSITTTTLVGVFDLCNIITAERSLESFEFFTTTLCSILRHSKSLSMLVKVFNRNGTCTYICMYVFCDTVITVSGTAFYNFVTLIIIYKLRFCHGMLFRLRFKLLIYYPSIFYEFQEVYFKFYFCKDHNLRKIGKHNLKCRFEL